MIHENNPANPVGMYGQQSATGETLLMKYSAMFMVKMIGNDKYDTTEADIVDIAQIAISFARVLIDELNKEIVPTKPVPQHEVNY